MGLLTSSLHGFPSGTIRPRDNGVPAVLRLVPAAGGVRSARGGVLLARDQLARAARVREALPPPQPLLDAADAAQGEGGR